MAATCSSSEPGTRPATAHARTSRSRSGTRPSEMSYGWPVKPFDVQHPVRGFFCDPRIGAKGSKAFHFGIDVSAPDGTAVYAVAGGKVHFEGGQNIGIVTGSGRSHGYWHIVPRVSHGQRVRKHALLGHVARSWGHVHFAERLDGKYWNPLREGALTPFHDFGAPVVDLIVAERASRRLDPGALTGVVNLIAVAHDNPPISAPPPWRGLPVTPALVRWRLVRDGRAVIPVARCGRLPHRASHRVPVPRDLRGGNTPEPSECTRPLPLLADPRLGHAPSRRRPLPAGRGGSGHSGQRLARAPRARALERRGLESDRGPAAADRSSRADRRLVLPPRAQRLDSGLDPLSRLRRARAELPRRRAARAARAGDARADPAAHGHRRARRRRVARADARPDRGARRVDPGGRQERRGSRRS